MNRIAVVLWLLGAVSALGASSGKSITIQADGSVQSFDNPGSNGADGYPGSDGYSPMCESCGGSYNVQQPSGGDGEDGGNGEKGGNGGDITVYYHSLSDLRAIRIRNTPGWGGRGAPGGRGGYGCRCPYYSWTVEDPPGSGTTQTYSCSDGWDGSPGSHGVSGGRGAYGSIFLIEGNQTVKAATPSLYVDMAKMETGLLSLSRNHWEARKGARSLFDSNSDLSDSYQQYLGRTEVQVLFKWAASRPVTDFSGWHMNVSLQGTEPKLSFPNGLMVDSEVISEGTRRTIIIHSALTSGEVAHLQLGSLTGFGTDLTIPIKDLKKVSDVVHTSVHLKYQTVEKGYYKVRFDAKVPETALKMSAGEIRVNIGQLGLSQDYLKPDLQTHVGLTVTRSLDGKSYKVSMGNYYIIKLLNVGSPVEALEDTKLYSGSSIVGEVKKGDRFVITAIQNGWASLKTPDGTTVKGWIKLTQLKLVQEYVGLNTLMAAEPLWKKAYWGWGQADSTQEASTKAFEDARPARAALRNDCDIQKGILTTSVSYGYCAKSEDPMFCKYGCWTCPMYGTATCNADTTTTIKVGALVEAIVDAKLYSGNKVVGEVLKGEKFHVNAINGQWVQLETLEGLIKAGWIKSKEIQRI